MDLIELLIEACNSEKKNVDSGMVAAQSLEALLAGYETTSNALAFISYVLALNPEVQDKLADEIHNHLAENPVSRLIRVPTHACTHARARTHTHTHTHAHTHTHTILHPICSLYSGSVTV